MFIHIPSHKQSNIRCNDNTYVHLNRKTQKVISLYDHVPQIEYEAWVKNGKLHRIDGPAVIRYLENGQLQNISWHINRKFHRIGAPAAISYFKNRQIRNEVWYKNGQLHRLGGAPADIEYFENGQIKYEAWYKYGEQRSVKKYYSIF